MFRKRSFLLAAALFFGIFILSGGLQASEKSSSLKDFFSSIFGPEKSEEFLKVLPLNPDGVFSLKNVNGMITIATWAEKKVEIKAVKKTKGNREDLDKVKIDIDSSTDSVSVDTVHPKIKNLRVKVDYEVKVPEGVNLDRIRSVNGGVFITGPLGNVNASTTNGDVKAEKASGSISLSTTNGDISASAVKGALEVGSTNGSIKLEVNSFEHDIRARTVNGGIALKIRDLGKVDADFEARTTNGSISVDFPVTLQSLTKSRRSLKGRIGEGGPLISLRTVNGSIKLTR